MSHLDGEKRWMELMVGSCWFSGWISIGLMISRLCHRISQNPLTKLGGLRVGGAVLGVKPHHWQQRWPGMRSGLAVVEESDP